MYWSDRNHVNCIGLKGKVLSIVLVLAIAMGSSVSLFAGGQEESEDEVGVEEPDIKIGLISGFTGVFASFGRAMRQGTELALEEYDYEIGGQKIQVIYEDSELDNELAVTRARKLIQQNQVDVLTGLVSGDEGLTVVDFMEGEEIPVVVMYSAPEEITQNEWYEYVVRSTWTGAQPMDPFGEWLAREKGFEKIYMIGQDYSYPYNQAGGFKRGFYRGGGEEVTTVWHPTPNEDYSSIIANIPTDEDYDAVLYNGAGGDAVAFVRQWVEFGMVDEIPLIGQSNTFERPDLDAMPEAIADTLGYSAHFMTDDLDTPEWKEFVNRYEERWGELPSASAVFAYESIQLIARAIERKEGDVSDPKALVEAMQEVDLSDSPRGPVRLDDYNAGISNVYIREVRVDDDGNLYNAHLATVEEVSQFGLLDPDTYMEQPGDSRDFPPDTADEMPEEFLDVGGRQYEFITD